MENQINMGSQNNQQIGQNPASQTEPIPEKPKINYWMISSVILAVILIIGGFYVPSIVKQSSKESSFTQQNPTVSPSNNSISIQPTTINNSLEKLGMFKVKFSYPSLGIPVIRICFESKNDLSRQFCFFKPDGIGSSIKSTDVSETFHEEGKLPAGQYYAYIIFYWKNQPGDIINLNACNYKGSDRGSFPERRVYCQEFDKQLEIRQKLCTGSGNWMSSLNRNIYFGGEREIFSIEPNKILDLGIISVLPN